MIAVFICCGVLFSQEATKEFVYESGNKRDPLTPLVTKDGFLISFDSEQELEDIRVEGIIYDENDISYAIINGNIVKTGDRIGSIKVIRIEKNKVIIFKNEQIFAIELEEEVE